MNQRARDQLVGFVGCLLIVAAAVAAWAAADGHVILFRSSPDGTIDTGTATKLF